MLVPKRETEGSASPIANFILVLGSLLVGLVLAEIGIRFLAPQPMKGIVMEYASRGYAVNRSAALFSVGENKGIYHFTSPHLRGIAPPTGAIRILAVGDLFTFGLGGTEEQTYVARLQKKLDRAFGIGRFVLLNAGISGSGSADQLAFLEDFGSDIALAQSSSSSARMTWREQEFSPLYRLLRPNGLDLGEGTVPTSKLKSFFAGSKIYNFLVEHLHTAQLIRRAVIEGVTNRHGYPTWICKGRDELRSGPPNLARSATVDARDILAHEDMVRRTRSEIGRDQ